jgi:type IV secretion system protein TrbL
MVLDKTDLQSWTSALIRKIMWIGAFYALLINGRNWIPAIIDSFEQIGSNAAAMAGPLSPSDVMAQGINIAGALMDFVVVMVESYIIVSVGFVFLGFGGSRWTAPYVERYIGLAVSIGIKIVLIYCLISAGFNLGVGWAAEAATVGASAHPALTAFDAMGGAVIFMMLCWQIPKLFGAVLGGAPALTGGDLVTTGTALAAGAFAVGSLGAGAVASLAGASSAGTVAGTTSAAKVGADGAAAARTSAEVSSAASATGRGGSVPPPGSSGPSANGTSPKTPSPPRGGPGSSGAEVDATGVSPTGSGSSTPPPANQNGSAGVSTTTQSALSDLGGEPLSGSGFERERPGKGFVQQSLNLGSDRPATDAGGDSSPSPLEDASQHPYKATEPVPPGSRQVKASVSAVAQRSNRNLNSAANRVRNIGRRIALDSAPQVSPPRMPIEHEE